MAPETRYSPQPAHLSITVLKTVDCNRSMSSNPIASAILLHRRARLLAGFVVSGVWERRQNNSFELLAGSYRWFRLAAWNARLQGVFLIKVSLERNRAYLRVGEFQE